MTDGQRNVKIVLEIRLFKFLEFKNASETSATHFLHLSACSTAASTWPGLLFQVPSPRIGIFIPLLRVREVVAILVVIFKLPAYRANVHKGSQRYKHKNQPLPYIQNDQPLPYLSNAGSLRMYCHFHKYTNVHKGTQGSICICPDRGH